MIDACLRFIKRHPARAMQFAGVGLILLGGFSEPTFYWWRGMARLQRDSLPDAIGSLADKLIDYWQPIASGVGNAMFISGFALLYIGWRRLRRPPAP